MLGLFQICMIFYEYSVFPVINTKKYNHRMKKDMSQKQASLQMDQKWRASVINHFIFEER